MQPNQQSFNIFVVSHPVAHCTPVQEGGGGYNGPLFSSRKCHYSESCEGDRNNKLISVIDNRCSIKTRDY